MTPADLPAPERCPTCDREGVDCARFRLWPWAGRLDGADDSIGDARYECYQHAVDWRARAIAAEIRAEEAEAHGAGSDALIDAICQRVGARDTGCGGQTVEAGEMRRRMNMTQRIDMLTTAAAQWAKVAPLIERLDRAAMVGASHAELLDAVADVCAVRRPTIDEATP